jgi:hypothetical protein
MLSQRELTNEPEAANVTNQQLSVNRVIQVGQFNQPDFSEILVDQYSRPRWVVENRFG